MLGVLKAGGAFVPLDVSHPIPRLQSLTQAVGGRILICSRQHANLLATVAETIMPLDGDLIERLPSGMKQDRYPSRAKSNNAAYVIFTSGSTGEPKASNKMSSRHIMET